MQEAPQHPRPSDRQTFPRHHRLLSGADYGAVLSQGRRHRAETITLVCLPSKCARLGIAVPKKQVKRAVHRNRVKRVLREAFRQQARALPAFDLVVLCRAGAIDSVRLRSDFNRLLDRLTNQTRRPRPSADRAPQSQER